jgi:hypothetical protein
MAEAETQSASLLQMPEHRNRSVQGKVHLLLALRPMVLIEKIHRLVFEYIMGEKTTTNPIELVGSR